MKKITLSFILTFTIILTMIPAMALNASAETTVSEVNLTCDFSALDLNVSWTEGEVQSRLLNHGVSVDTTGTRIDFNNVSLMYYNPVAASLYGISDGSSMVNAEKSYYLKVCLDVDSDYDWIDSAKNVNKEEITGLTVIFNGKESTSDCIFEYNSFWNNIKVYIPAGVVSTEPRVKSISVDENDFALEKGGSHTFSAFVDGTVSDKTVIWSVSGATSANTDITSGGLLTIGEDETAESLVVKAEAAADTSKYVSVVVTVLEEAPAISSVVISPKTYTIMPGNTVTFSKVVTGTQTDKNVTWSVLGANNPNTTISSGGVLSVSIDETATSLTVKAVANKDNSKFDTATVTVQPFIRIDTISLVCDPCDMGLNTESTEEEVCSRVNTAFSVTGSGYRIDLSNTYMVYYDDDICMGTGNSTNKINPERAYYYLIQLILDTGYDWINSAKKSNPDEITGLTVVYNGNTITENCKIYYNTSARNMKIYIPAGDVCVNHDWTTNVVSRASIEQNGSYTKTCTRCGYSTTETALAIKSINLEQTSYDYDGTTKEPAVIVTDAEDKPLVCGVDYTVTYENNLLPGTATATITGIGYYEGTYTRYFTINKSGLYETRLLMDGRTRFLCDGTEITATTLIKYDGVWYYVQKGISDPKANALVKYNDKWYYVKNGVKTNSTLLFKHTDGKWYYVKNGVVTKNTLLFKHTDGKWYYIKNGVVTKNTLLFKHTDGKWYHIKNGVKSNDTILFKHTDGKWYYIKNGDKTIPRASLHITKRNVISKVAYGNPDSPEKSKSAPRPIP